MARFFKSIFFARFVGIEQIKRTISYKKPEIMVRLYKTLVRPHLEYCVSAWSPHYIKDEELLERVQHRFTRMIKEVRGKDYLDRLKELNFWTLTVISRIS